MTLSTLPLICKVEVGVRHCVCIHHHRVLLILHLPPPLALQRTIYHSHGQVLASRTLCVHQLSEAAAEQESIFCENCYEKKFAKTCYSCRRPIVGVSQSVSQSVCQSVRPSVCQSVSQSVSQPASQSVSQSASQSVSQSASQSVSLR